MSPALRTILLVVLALFAGACGDSRDSGRGGSAQGGSPTHSEATPTPASTAADTAAWTQPKLMHRLAGRRIRVGDQTVRVDPGTVTCGGVGRPVARTGDKPAWRRFRCVQPTFPPGSVAGPDAIFFVQPVDRRRLTVTDQRLTRY